MKKKSTFTILAFGAIALFLLQGNSSGSPSGRTGAPGDQTCGTSSCHNADVNTGSATIEIIVDDSLEQYQPGVTHRIKMSISNGQNAAKNGFQVTALDGSDNFVGSFTLVDDNITRQRTANNRDYITHTTNGNTLTSWEVDWTAPETEVGDITFYLAVNDANGIQAELGMIFIHYLKR